MDALGCRTALKQEWPRFPRVCFQDDRAATGALYVMTMSLLGLVDTQCVMRAWLRATSGYFGNRPEAIATDRTQKAAHSVCATQKDR